MNVNYKDLQEKFGNEAKEKYQAVAKIAGGDPDIRHDGGIDLTELASDKLAEVNKILGKSPAKKEEPKKEGN